MALYQLIYVSLADHAMASAELLALLDEARVHNLAHGITGILAYHNHEFLQLIEGEQPEVLALFERIARDPRHQQLAQIWEGPIAVRSCNHWAMGFVAPDEQALRGRPGYETLLNEGLFALASGRTTGHRVLMSLKDDFLALS